MALCLLLAGCYQPPDEVNNGGPTGAITASFFNTLAPKATSTPVAPDTVVVETTNPNIGVVGNQETPTPTSGSSIGSAWDNWGSAPTDVLTPTPDGYTGVTPAPTDGSGNITVITTAPPTASPTPAPVTPSPVPKSLQKGFTGSDAVRAVQKRLKELGYYKGSADGDFGPATEDAVKAFQKANGLTADGAAGEQTQRVLYGGNAKAANVKTTAAPQQAATATAAPATSGTLKVGSTGTDVQTLQQKLIELGYLKGSADGVFGNKTAAAVKAYQKASKLTADGVAGSQTLSSLNAVAANKNAASSNTAANTSQKTTVTPSAARVQYANWYEKVKSVARSYPYATVYDIGTGISWQVHIFSLGAHADYEPVTANDTARMEKVFGGNTWNPRAVWVIFSDGSIYIGSTHSMPHEVQHVRDNNFNGHSCLHFPRTQEQVTSIGPYATKHQETIDAGWAATQKMK